MASWPLIRFCVREWKECVQQTIVEVTLRSGQSGAIFVKRLLVRTLFQPLSTVGSVVEIVYQD